MIDPHPMSPEMREKTEKAARCYGEITKAFAGAMVGNPSVGLGSMTMLIRIEGVEYDITVRPKLMRFLKPAA